MVAFIFHDQTHTLECARLGGPLQLRIEDGVAESQTLKVDQGIIAIGVVVYNDFGEMAGVLATLAFTCDLERIGAVSEDFEVLLHQLLDLLHGEGGGVGLLDVGRLDDVSAEVTLEAESGCYGLIHEYAMGLLAPGVVVGLDVQVRVYPPVADFALGSKGARAAWTALQPQNHGRLGSAGFALLIQEEDVVQSLARCRWHSEESRISHVDALLHQFRINLGLCQVPFGYVISQKKRGIVFSKVSF
mmetsp:Transcript_56899/g.123826  ORF Transcript_56899/g.123826 Transcript_56899/m.123826 type:complete len:245 (+) Transcript_56899:896-1630(+)